MSWTVSKALEAESSQALTRAANKLQIRSIWEPKLQLMDFYYSRHSVVVVLLASGAWYIVDPTGIQFGPEWPLVCRYEDHRGSFFVPTWRYWEFFALGTEARDRYWVRWELAHGHSLRAFRLRNWQEAMQRQ